MRIRDLKRTVGKATISVWPPMVSAGSFGAGDSIPMPGDGTLKAVRRVGERLAITFLYEGRDHAARLEWDAPPGIAAVETTLKGQLGQPMKDVGAAEIGLPGAGAT
jgi:hypothetical protein